MSKKCNLSVDQLEQLERFLNNKSNNTQDPAERDIIKLRLLKQMETASPGIIEQYENYLKEQTKGMRLTETETTELNSLLDKALKGPSITKNLNSTEQARLFVLAEKAQNTTGGNPLLFARAKEYITQKTQEKAQLTVSAIELLEKQRNVAERNGDLEMVAKIDKILTSMEKATEISRNLKIDWDAIQKVQDRRSQLMTELAILEALKSVGDGERVQKILDQEKEVTRLLTKIKELKSQIKVIRGSEVSEEEQKEEIEPIVAEIAEIQQKIQKISEKITKGLSVKSRERLNKIQAKITSIQSELQALNTESTDLSFVETMIYSATPDKDWFLASARDLLQKKKKVQDNINFIEKTIKETKDDYEYTRREVETLFGQDPFLLSYIRSKFSNLGNNPDAKNQTPEEKKTISKEEVLDIFSKWSEIQRESVFDPGFDAQETKIIADMVRFTDRELITDVDPESPQPISFTKEESANTTRGYTYQADSKDDRVKLIADLQKMVGRLNTIGKLPRFNGLIPEWALVSALGSDAQSLFNLFDGAVVNPQSIFYDDEMNPIRFSDDHQRRSFLENILYNYGFDEGTFANTPENNIDFKSDFRNLIGTSFAVNKEGKIVGIYQTVRSQNSGKSIITETRPPIYSSNGKGQPLTQDDILNALALFEEQMNSGFKVVTHNAFQPDGILQKLVEQGGNAKLTFRIAVRLFDTGMMAYRSSRDNGISRFNGISLKNLTDSLLTTGAPLVSETEVANQINNNIEEAELNLNIESKAVIDILLTMQANQSKELTIKDTSGQTKVLSMNPVSALWMDGTGDLKGFDFNLNYKGLLEIFDIGVFFDLKNFRGESAGRITMYDLAEVQAIATNLMFIAMEEINPTELNNILTGLVAAPKDSDRHFELSMKLSKKFHEAYIERKRQERNENDNQYILEDIQDSDGTVKPNLTSSNISYVSTAIKELRETLKAYKRSFQPTIAKFAKLVGFREQTVGESDEIYLNDLFMFTNKEFNGDSYSFLDYGNGTFDYISAKQLGRGFAQVILGHIREGNTLTQNIDIPLDAVRQLKEERQADKTNLDVEDIESNIEERQYLPLTRTNVSYFAPLSMYEQERIYSDWALRKRYKHILSKNLTDEDRKRFVEFIKTNKIVDFRNKITEIKTNIDRVKANLSKDTENAELKETLKSLETSLKAVKEEYASYMETLDDRRLEQGRVQTWSLLNPVSNYDLYTRVPTMDESVEMSLEIAFEIPQLIATYVHDSRNYVEGSKTHLEKETYMADPGKSAGGPGAQSTWAGIHPLIGFMTMYPQKYRPTDAQIQEMILEAESNKDDNLVKRLKDMLSRKDKYGIIDLTPEILKQSLLEGYKARKEDVKYTKSTYFDDKFSGIHHLIAAQEAYMPSSRSKTLLNELAALQRGQTTVTADQLDDYYEKTFMFTVEHAERLRERILNSKWNQQQKQEKLKQLERVLFILNKNKLDDGSGTPTKSARDFFKGVVIPVIYSGGAAAVVNDLKIRRKKAIKTEDPNNPDIGDLTDSEIEVLAHVLAAGATNTTGRIIDEIIDLNPEAATKLVGILTGETKDLISKYRLDISKLIELHPEVVDGFVNHELLRGAIQARIRYVADLSISPLDVNLRFDTRSSDELGLDKAAIKAKMVDEKAKQLETKWKDRIEKAIKRLEEYHNERGVTGSQVGFKLGSQIEHEINVILAGGEKQYRTQASLLFLNKVQNSGYNLNATDDALLEHRVKTGRYISPEDIMFQNYVVFMSAAYGTSTGRMQYPGNYLTNLQGSSLSKGFRLVFNEDGSLNMDDTVLGSMWKLTENPLANLTPEKAVQHARDLAIKNYSLMLATDYDPEFLGYNADEEENRSLFFDDWYERSKTERTFSHKVKPGGVLREQYKKLYRDQQRAILKAQDKFTDEQIEDMLVDVTEKDLDDDIDSNSVAFDKRETVRILAPDALASDSGTLMTGKDAKGLGAFIPRIADHDAKDHIVHGLYTMHHGTKRARLKGGQTLLQINAVKRDKPKLKDILEKPRKGSSVYNPDTLPYIPVTGDSLPEMLLDHEPSIMQKTASLQNTLEIFAVENGYDSWLKEKDYPHLYQIYQIHLKLRKLSNKLHRMNPDTVKAKELKMEFRNLVLDLFKLTKVQRDAKKSERSILDFRRAVSIDPTKFKYADGANMRYLDVLKTLSKLGIEELYTLQFGVAPTELHVLGDQPADVLKEVSTIVKPFYVQGHDVALLMMEVLAHDVIKRRATEVAKRFESSGRITTKLNYDKQGFVILSDIEETMVSDILAEVLKDDALVDSAANNLNLYVTLEWGMNTTASNPKGQPRAKVTTHKPSPSVMVMPRRGVGDPVTNRTRVGPRQAHFMLTAEAIKRILTGARNHGLLSKVHLSLQTNKYLGTRTNVDTLRSESFREFGRDLKQEVAEEVEILERLIGPSPQPGQELRKLVTQGVSELKDEFGLTLNPYDAEYYFHDDGTPSIVNPKGKPHFRNMTPFKAAISSRIRKMIKIGKVFPTLTEDIQTLEEFYNGNNLDFVPVSFLIFLKSNVKDLGLTNYKILVEEVMGVESISEEEFKKFNDKADLLLGIMDKIQFSPTKGKNPYLSLALKQQETVDLMGNVWGNYEVSPNDIPDINNPEFEVRNGRTFKVVSSAPVPTTYTKDLALKAQAIREARELRNYKSSLEIEAFPSVTEANLMAAAYDPENLEAILPADAAHIETQLNQLVANGTISDEVAVFYRYLIMKVLKTNPNLAPLLSLTSVNTSSNIAGSAIKQDDKFIIKLNTNVLKNMGTVDQIRVFAHEMAHIARMAFIRDNSKEWNSLLSIFKSTKGKATIETMLLAMNNGKKYIGFDEDVRHYLSHPEEFAAQWGGWVLFQKTFNNVELLKFLQSRNRGAEKANQIWKAAIFAVSKEVTGVASGLNSIDEKLLNEIFEVVDNMFGFTLTEHRRVFVENANNELFMIGNLQEPITRREEARLEVLESMLIRSPAEQEEYITLSKKYETYSVFNLTKTTYNELRSNRQKNNSEFNLDTAEPAEKLEVIQTFVQTSLQRAATNARANHTFGGLTRNLAEKIFGETRANKIIAARRFMALGTNYRYTFDSSNPIVSGLMNIIGDTLSMHAYQFQTTSGSLSIMPNRMNTRVLIERVSMETNNLLLEAEDKEEFRRMQEWAVKTALGQIVPTPPVSKPEVLTAATLLAQAFKVNSTDLRNFIYGSYGSRKEILPIQWQAEQVGDGNPKTLTGYSSKKHKQQQAANRQTLETELSSMIRNKLDRGEGIDATVLYVMNILPREMNLESVQAWMRTYPDVANALRSALVDRLGLLLKIEDINAERIVNIAFAQNFVMNPAKPGIPGDGATTEMMLTALEQVVQEIYGKASIGQLGSAGIDVLTAIQQAVKNSLNTDVNNLSALSHQSRESSINPNIMRIRDISAFSNVDLSGKPAVVLARLLAGHIANNPVYLNSSSFMTLGEIMQNPVLVPFVDTGIHTGMYQLERTQGYMKTSEHAIENITGIKGMNIQQLLSLLKSQIINIKGLSDKERKDLEHSLIIIEEKIKVDQGLGIRDINPTHPVFEFMAKWGPDITRMTHGNNLNTASLLVEGGMGLVVSYLYGGDILGQGTMKFASTVFQTLLSSYFGRKAFKRGFTQIEQRGAAVNLLLGIEKMIQDSREVMHISDSTFDKNAGKLQKLRDWMRQANNRGLTSVQAGLYEQSQWIFKKNLLNGNIARLKDLVENGYNDPKTGTVKRVTNLTELDEAMSIVGISKRKLKPHMAMMIIQSGILDTNALNAYRHMDTVVDKKNTGKWGLDLQEAGRWIERTAWVNGSIVNAHGNVITRDGARKAIASIYRLNREFSTMVTVDPNSFDSATATNPMLALFFFYRQYPNLFLSQKMFRLAGRMDKRSWAAMMIASSVLDLVYNLLLAVAAGAIPLAALWPFHEDSIFKKDPSKVAWLLATRNPIFSPSINLIAEAIHQGTQRTEKVKENKYQNRYTKVQEGVRTAAKELTPDFVGIQSAQTLAGGLVPTAVLGIESIYDSLVVGQVGGKLNEQEHWDWVSNTTKVLSRMLPGVELPIRALMPSVVEETIGARPVKLPVVPFGQSPFAQPNVPTKTYQQPNQQQRQQPRQPAPPMVQPRVQPKVQPRIPSLRTEGTTPIKAPL